MNAEIKLVSVNYVINDDSIYCINVTFSGYKDGQSVNATISITGDKVLDMTPSQAESVARKQLSSNIASGFFSEPEATKADV